ncbi:MAG: hypothetical protein EPO24_07790 [Bacteroidetes bacterium]|nr:MAG: hypothetical protein EPO24_07790 [Bacteroidota bacterium]
MPEKTDRELLQETHDEVIMLRSEVKGLRESKDDHETRLRILERYGAIMIGGGLVLQFILTKVHF